MQITPNKKIYFASDQHFGAPTPELSFPREQKFVAWLDEVKKDADAIFLLGDLFDFWFEYKTVVPKGFVRVLGKLAEIRDSGIPIYFFVGNHRFMDERLSRKRVEHSSISRQSGIYFEWKNLPYWSRRWKRAWRQGLQTNEKSLHQSVFEMVVPMASSRHWRETGTLSFGKKTS